MELDNDELENAERWVGIISIYSGDLDMPLRQKTNCDANLRFLSSSNPLRTFLQLELWNRMVASSLADMQSRYDRAVEKTALLEDELVEKSKLEEENQRLKDEVRGESKRGDRLDFRMTFLSLYVLVIVKANWLVDTHLHPISSRSKWRMCSSKRTESESKSGSIKNSNSSRTTFEQQFQQSRRHDFIRSSHET